MAYIVGAHYFRHFTNLFFFFFPQDRYLTLVSSTNTTMTQS